jgi:hypothetical protein
MEPLDHVVLEIDGLERYLSRRGFLKAAALFPIVSRTLSTDDRRFLAGAARAVIPAAALESVAVDVLANIEHLLERANADHRARALRAIAWARRISFFYGGEAMPLRARDSRFFVVRRLARAVSVVCLVAFWGDERTLSLIDMPAESP